MIAPNRHLRLIGAAAATAVMLSATIVSLGLGGAAAATSGPTVYEQQAVGKSIKIATGNVHTTISRSPVLAQGTYLVHLTLQVTNVAPGAVVLCGDSTTAVGDVVTGNFGQYENEGTTASGGNCTITGTVQINNASDHITSWATVYSGPGAPQVASWSENETPVGNAIVN